MNERKSIHLDNDDEYLKRIAAAKEKKTPLGGAPMPTIKPFDEYKNDQRSAGVQGGAQIDAFKMLSEIQIAELRKRGKFVEGAGSGFAGNQPFAHEVLSLSQTPTPPEQPLPQNPLPPVEPGQYQNPPRPAGEGLTPKTVEGLVALAQENVKEKESKKEEMTDEEFKAEVDKISSEVDFQSVNQQVVSALELRERRRRIELRCEPLDLGQLISHFEVRQRVPIVPGQYEPTFRTMSGHEDLEIKRLIGIEAAENNDNRYIVDKYSLCNLVCALYSLNQNVFPSHLDQNGQWSKEAFLLKYKLVLRYPILMLGDLSINQVWFNHRVQKLLMKGDLKDF